MKRYIVTADYYDCRDLWVYSNYWIIDVKRNYCKPVDADEEVRKLIQAIRRGAKDGKNLSNVNIDVYELGKEVTDKFLNDEQDENIHSV